MLTDKNLHNYQRACVSHIIDNPYCGVFLDMGLGKTVSTLTAVNLLMYDYCEIDSVLVIAPKRVAETVWQEEAEKWAHLRHIRFSKIIGTEAQRVAALKQKADVYIISRDNVAWLCSRYGGGRLPFEMYVIDELSSFKSPKSMRFKSLRNVRPYMKRVVGLTGTPAPNGLIDLWSQVYLIDRGVRLEKTVTAYRQRYFIPAQTNGHVVYSYKLKENSERLISDKIKDICMSMKAKDYLQLPEATYNNISIKMSEKLKKQYRDFEKEKVLELFEGDTQISVANAATLANKLLQFANGAIYDEEHNFHEIHELKLDALKEIIEDANGKPVLVAWSFQHDRDRILEYLKSYKPRELKTPRDIEEWNDGKIQLLLAHPASAGHGLNLQAGGNIIVWYGLTWSLELYQQFNARLHRQGQKHAVIIHHIALSGTYDTNVLNALTRKDMTQNALLRSIKARVEQYAKSTSG